MMTDDRARTLLRYKMQCEQIDATPDGWLARAGNAQYVVSREGLERYVASPLRGQPPPCSGMFHWSRLR